MDILIFFIGRVYPDAQMGTSDGLSCRGTDHHITHALVAWLWLGDGKHIRHMQQTTRETCIFIRLEFHHVDTHRQSFERHRVLEDFVGLFACVGMGLLTDHFPQMGLYLCITLRIVG